MGTKFTDIYNRFLGKITDDLYIELTPEDTIKDLRAMLLNILPEFEFPRFDIYNYTIDQEIKYENEILEDVITVAINNVLDQIKNEKEKKLGKYTNGLGGLF